MRQAVVDLASQPIRNLYADPRATKWSTTSVVNNRWGPYTTYSLIANATDGPAGITTYARGTVTGAHSSLGFHLPSNVEQTAPDTNTALLPVYPGDTIGPACFWRSSVTCTVQMRVRFADASLTTWTGSQVATATSVPADTWTRVALNPVVVPPGAVGAAVTVTASQTFDPGVTFDVTGLTFYTVFPGAPYGDGNTPGWTWTGSANASESVGYPYTLESIAGRPTVEIFGAGSGTLTGIGNTSGRTLYTVHDVSATVSGGQSVVARFGQPASDIARSRFLYISGSYSIDFFDATNTPYQVASNTRSAGRHVGCLTISEGIGRIIGQVDGGAEISTYTASNLTITDPSVLTYTNNPDAAAFYTVAYPVEHNAPTRNRIMAWLARQYGAPVPAGY